MCLCSQSEIVSIDWQEGSKKGSHVAMPTHWTKRRKKNNNFIPTWFVFPTFFFSRFWLCSKYLRRPVTKSRHFLVLSSGSIAELIWLFFLSFWFFAQLSRFVIHQHYSPPSPFPIQLMPSLPNPFYVVPIIFFSFFFTFTEPGGQENNPWWFQH